MKGVVARGLLVVSLVLAAYVLYAHLAEWHVAREYLEEPIAMRFAGSEWARGLDVVKKGAFDVTTSAGALDVRGPTSGANGELSSLELRTPVRRLRDAELRLRFRLRERADVDVGVAVVREGSDARVGFGVRAGGDVTTVRFLGDERAEPPRAGGAGDGMEKQRTIPLERTRDEHEIALRLSPDLHTILGSVDGEPAASHVAEWEDGEPVRATVFVRARSPGQHVDVELAQADYVPLSPDVRRRDLDERFDGQVLDPSLWRVVLADGWSADGSVTLVRGGGLDLAGHALRPTGETPIGWLVGPTRPLGSFRAHVGVDLRKLHHARFFVGVSNLLFGLTNWRTFEVGLVDGLTPRQPYVAGHWSGDQQLQVESLPAATSDATRVEIAIDYDAHTRTATATLDGRPLVTKRLDFLPPEETHLELGVRATDGDGDADVVVTRVTYEARP